MSFVTQGRCAWLACFSLACATAAAASEQDVKDTLSAQQSILSRAYEIGKKVKNPTPEKLQLLNQMTYTVSGSMVRSSMIKNMDEQNQATADRLAREFKSRPSYKKMEAAAKEVIQNRDKQPPPGKVLSSPPPAGQKGQAGVVASLKLPSLDLTQISTPVSDSAPMPASVSESKPEVVLDGSGIEKELEFTGKKEKGESKKPSLREQVLEEVRKKLKVR